MDLKTNIIENKIENYNRGDILYLPLINKNDPTHGNYLPCVIEHLITPNGKEPKILDDLTLILLPCQKDINPLDADQQRYVQLLKMPELDSNHIWAMDMYNQMEVIASTLPAKIPSLGKLNIYNINRLIFQENTLEWMQQHPGENPDEY